MLATIGKIKNETEDNQNIFHKSMTYAVMHVMINTSALQFHPIAKKCTDKEPPETFIELLIIIQHVQVCSISTMKFRNKLIFRKYKTNLIN